METQQQALGGGCIADTYMILHLTDADDIEVHLTTFECVMSAYVVPKERWSIHLVPQLTGNAQQANAAMLKDSVRDYVQLKTANLCIRGFAQQPKGGETFHKLATRLTYCTWKWTRDFMYHGEQTLEAIVEEQLILTLL